MADLEDFFAKRDKKKKTKKFESVDIDNVAKVLEEKARERKKNEQYVPPPGVDGSVEQGTPSSRSEDAEWKEEVETAPDFTGLKIQEFTLEEEKGEEKEEKSTTVIDGGPWGRGKVESMTATAQAPPPKEIKPESPAIVAVATPGASGEGAPPPSATASSEEEKPPQEGVPAAEQAGGEAEGKKYLTPRQRVEQQAAAKTVTATPAAGPPSAAPQLPSSAGGKYVPPSQRLGAGGGAPTPSTTPKAPTRRTAAPNIQSESNFPSLGAAAGKS